MYQANRRITAKVPSLRTRNVSSVVTAQARNVTTCATNTAKMKARVGAIGVPLMRKLRYDARNVIVRIQSSLRIELNCKVTTTR